MHLGLSKCLKNSTAEGKRFKTRLICGSLVVGERPKEKKEGKESKKGGKKSK
jgi:hypothetical protein